MQRYSSACSDSLDIGSFDPVLCMFHLMLQPCMVLWFYIVTPSDKQWYWSTCCDLLDIEALINLQEPSTCTCTHIHLFQVFSPGTNILKHSDLKVEDILDSMTVAVASTTVAHVKMLKLEILFKCQ